MNDLLQEKYRVQKTLDEKANHSLIQYVANSHAKIKEVEVEYGIKFEYIEPVLKLSNCEH
jgi:hypothetical protein